jgi:shikimate dehydrogenase
MNLQDKQVHTPNGTTRLLALFGKDLSYSRSPQLHNTWIQKHGLNACYVPIEWNTTEDFLSGIQSLSKSKTFLGGNITNPFKPLAPSSGLFESDERVQAIGAANTLFRKNSKWVLTNTDVDGISATLLHGADNFETSEWDVVILGAGGAAAAAAFTLTRQFQNCRVNCALRNPSRAHPFLISAGTNQILVTEDSLTEESSSAAQFLAAVHSKSTGRRRILINTTPLGQKSEMNPMANVIIRDWLGAASESSFYFDMAYGENPALELAKEHGIPHSNGMTMLIAQAEKSFAIWKDSLAQGQ